MSTNFTPNSANGQSYATRTQTQGHVLGGHKATHESVPRPFAALCQSYGWEAPAKTVHEEVRHVLSRLATTPMATWTKRDLAQLTEQAIAVLARLDEVDELGHLTPEEEEYARQYYHWLDQQEAQWLADGGIF